MNRIYLSPPDIREADRALLLEALDSGWVAPLGPAVDGFEQDLAAATKRSHACALSSGTGALHLALVVLGVQAGDRVVVSTLTFAASANAIRYVNAEPVFVDSDLATWNMDPDLLAEELAESSRNDRLPKAVIAVDIYGQCADYDRISALCHEYGVPLIEDAAESLGASYRGEPAGSFGDLAVLSFNGNKIITTSGGGALLGSDQAVIDKARNLASQAREPLPHYEHTQVGYNYRLSNLLAALGRGQLSTLDDRVATRRQHNAWYRQALQDLPGFAFMPESPGSRSSFWLTTLTIDPDQAGTDSESIRLQLEEHNIEARPVWMPMHQQPVFRACDFRGSGVSDKLFADGLCLPSGSTLRPEDRERIATIVHAAVPS